ncbi:spore coat associated protein CotJA [Brevibacillus humidisoli]|uniref:spore coat associated protein CotJA n=1 Tax=Brevibacillus humidisoli TaxID=2895522 RepID=UPI001E64E94C|nr:spore coat associated protein CotJA [Brevibacillus humidisoli]UFJ42016.1 spore coat associated protein CotJA [Brevibacillus humidisoli]
MGNSYKGGSPEENRALGRRGRHWPPEVRRGYPPVNLPPVKPYPPDPYIDQFPLPEALRTGTLFRWLYDPYVNPYEYDC